MQGKEASPSLASSRRIICPRATARSPVGGYRSAYAKSREVHELEQSSTGMAGGQPFLDLHSVAPHNSRHSRANDTTRPFFRILPQSLRVPHPSPPLRRVGVFGVDVGVGVSVSLFVSRSAFPPNLSTHPACTNSLPHTDKTGNYSTPTISASVTNRSFTGFMSIVIQFLVSRSSGSKH